MLILHTSVAKSHSTNYCAGEQLTGNVDHNETTFTTMFTDENGTSTESSTESGFLSLSTAEIGGIGAAGSLLFLVLLCILIACFCYYRQKRMNKLMLVEKQHIVNQFILK